MIKLAQRLNDKILILDGAVPKILGAWVRKNFSNNAPDGENTLEWRAGHSEAGDITDFDCLLCVREGNGQLSTTPGSYLNEKALAHLGRYLYSGHGVQHERGGMPQPETYYMTSNIKFLQWDGVDYNNPDAWPSGEGARFLWGYSPTVANRYYYLGGIIRCGADIGVIPYNGVIFGIGAAFKHNLNPAYYSTSPMVQGNEAVKITGHRADITSYQSLYYTFLYDPTANNGSGLTTFNCHMSPSPNTDPPHSRITVPSWMDYITAGSKVFIDAAKYNYSITDIEEYRGKIYIANACHLIRTSASGIADFSFIQDTSTTAYTVTPKWLCVYNEKLYMLTAKGAVSEIIPTTSSATVSGVVDLSYVNIDVRYGGIHAREWGIDRATKNGFFKYGDNLHVMMGAGSGTYHLYSNGSLSTWTNATDSLPDIIKNNPGNVYTYEDTDDGSIYVVFHRMCSQGALGIKTFNNKVANIGYIYSYNGTTWTEIGWFPYPSLSCAGGLVGFDYEGPHVEMPSGVSYPYSGSPTINAGDVPPVVYKCRDYVLIDYKLIDQQSRTLNVSIEYSLNDGYSWNTCERFKDYATWQYLGEGKTGLTSSPSGEWHVFYWSFVQDLGYNGDYPYTKIRIIPRVA